MKKIYLLITMLLVLFTFKSHSQTLDKNRILDNWSFGINAGIPMFWGDVESTLSDKFKVSTAWGLQLTKKLNNAFDIRGEFIVGGVAGSQPKYNRYFEADFYDYHIDGTLNFTNLIYGENPCRKLNIYGILGIGFMQYRSLLKNISNDNIIAHRAFKSAVGGSGEEWETETFLAGGIGFSYRIDSRFDFIAENQWHVLNTDLLDCKVGWFKYDIVSYTSIGITYKFNFRKNPGTFVDCTKGGNTKGKLDDGTVKNYNNVVNNQVDSSKYYKNITNVNNYYYNKDTVINVINESDKIKAIENKIRDLEYQKKANAPTNVTPNNNATPTQIQTVDEDAMRRRILKEVMDSINNMPKPTNNVTTVNNNVTPAPVQTIDENAMRRRILKEVMDSINNMPKPKPINTTTTNNTTTTISCDNLDLLSVYFDFNKSIIRATEMDKIENVAKLMLKDPTLRILVSGHCDQKGTEKYNERLSKRRANAVAKMLVKKYGISADRITKEYKGKRNPLSKDHSINRRVDFIKQ